MKRKRKEKKKKRKKKSTSKNDRIAILLYSTFTESLLFSTVLLFVETVMPIKTGMAVHLMVSFAIDIVENIRARLTFFYSKL